MQQYVLTHPFLIPRWIVWLCPVQLTKENASIPKSTSISRDSVLSEALEEGFLEQTRDDHVKGQLNEGSRQIKNLEEVPLLKASQGHSGSVDATRWQLPSKPAFVRWKDRCETTVVVDAGWWMVFCASNLSQEKFGSTDVEVLPF